MTKIPIADTQADAERAKRAFQSWCTKKGVGAVGHLLDRDWERMVAFHQFPEAHWKHLRTTNPVVGRRGQRCRARQRGATAR